MLAPELTLADVVPGRQLEALLRSLRPSADGSLAVLVALTEHPHPAVRAALAHRLPMLPHGPAGPAPALVSALARLVGDEDADTREAACFALATMWRDHDAPGVCDALAARLEDQDDDADVRHEALLGLAHRHDPRALPAVAAALAADDGPASRLVLEAAGALGDPSLHEVVRAHAEAWLADADADPADLDVVEAVVRLTDPDGVGDDLLDGVADLCRARAHGRAPGRSVAAWEQLDAVLDVAPHRARQALEEVAVRLDGDPAALHHLRHASSLGQLAAALPPL
ncbi:HEAT repeat domain-containing protein [Quadrisphaera oryzae]|uniref:HEAT repeat domain-containing protein n=1 Tax=Quadrisphaera TaxID=317661 RepID=UPI0016442B1F|nr:HEAT repeat domain-containing protein [Quadrisphaera sp. RL12-1S]